ncbi:sodium:solute symporter family protein [Flavobacterium nackdongense]|uniref:Sodium:solute symporter family protein n=1 Tax=Flavobacterium nackdongense TaxID=2547394 RepID=A0A4P6YBY6_9FLAO|nr:sodium:solute symporter family protein [Flavobacterium nackdongense]QBN17850.1 sodium:solute symporter family protein [Flavobacterium nackdongense]
MKPASLWGLSSLDLVIILIYFIVIIIIAFRAARLVNNREDYFMAGRRFGKLIQTFAAFGQATSVENVTTTTTMVNSNGASGIWAMLAGGLINLPVFWMTSIWYRRLRLLTLGDFFEERYSSKKMAAFYALCQTIFFVLIAAIGLVAMSKTVSAIAAKPVEELNPVEKVSYYKAIEREKLEAADFALLTANQKTKLVELQLLDPKKEYSYIDENWLIVIVAFVTLLYASIGGLAAAFMVDLIQGIFIILLSIMLIPFAMAKINVQFGSHGILGSFETMHKVLPASFMEIWGSPSLIEFSWYWIAGFSIMIILTTAVQANQMTACGSAKDDYTARYGFVSGMLLKRYSSVMWGIVALMTVVLYGGTISDPDYVWGHATRDLLGPLHLGLVGLMIACLIAALMAAKSAFMLTAAALVTNNLYRPFRPNCTENHYIWAGRIFSALYMIVSAYIAMQSNGIFELFKMTMMFNSILAAAFWLGMLWRRSNPISAWVSMVFMFIATLILPFGIPVFPGVRSSEYLCKTTQAIPVTRSYTAREMDVKDRNLAIASWNNLKAIGKAEGEKPLVIQTGQKFEKKVLLPKKSIFWSEGLDYATERPTGKGYLKVELIALDLMGWDLSKNSYSLNETLTFLFRIIIPFLILTLVAFFTKPQKKAILDQFYGKMLTPVVGTHEDDDREMLLTRTNPTRFNHLKIFPKSNWEFRIWNREDWTGVIVSCFAVASVVALLVFIVSLGGA